MSWWNPSGTIINEVVRIREQQHRAWPIRLTEPSGFQLSVILNSGPGVDIYTMPESEYRNYQRGRVFEYLAELSYENAARFSNTIPLSPGSYRLVISNPHRILDGWENISEVAVRVDILR